MNKQAELFTDVTPVTKGQVFALWNSTVSQRRVIRGILAENPTALAQFEKVVVPPTFPDEPHKTALWSRKIATAMTCAAFSMGEAVLTGNVESFLTQTHTPKKPVPDATVSQYIEETLTPAVNRFHNFAATILGL